MRLLAFFTAILLAACEGGGSNVGDDSAIDTIPPVETDVYDTGIPGGPIPDEDTKPGGGPGDVEDTSAGECRYGDTPDCDDRCFPDYFIGDGQCDDGSAFRSNFDCAEHGFDGGDCLSETDIPPPIDEVGCPVIVRTFTGNWAVEIGWKITQGNRTLLNKLIGAYTVNNTMYADLIYLQPGTYRFVLRDLLGDGWNGATYSISNYGTEIAGGTLGSGFSRTDSFTVTCDLDTGEPPPPVADCGEVNLQINTLQFGHQIGWQLKDRDGDVIVGAPYNTYANNRLYEHPASLPEGWYIFTLLDNYGDGWNGATYNIIDSSSGQSLTQGTLQSGSYMDVPFLLACTPGFDPGPPPLVQGIECEEIQVRLHTGPDAAQVGWQLLDGAGQVVVDMQPGSYADFGVFVTPVEVGAGDWTLRLLDAGGDGWAQTTLELIDLGSGYLLAQGGATFTAGGSQDVPVQVACTDTPDPPSPACAPGAVQDCSLVCWPEELVGDGWCDDGTLFAPDFDCPRFQRDGGDCP